MKKLSKTWKQFSIKPLVKELIKLGIISFALLIFYALLYKIYFPRINAFGCFDDCANIGAAYFMTRGHELYSQIFFNHQPLSPYLSFAILSILKPNGIYELLLDHLRFLYVFSFIFSIFIIRRFSTAGIIFVVFYELTKFYLFGHRFIAESFIVYPVVYMAGLVWLKYQGKKIYSVEYILSAIFTWFVIFSREPYALLGLAEYFLVLGIPKTKLKLISIGIFGVLSAVTILVQPIRDYAYAIFVVNFTGLSNTEAQTTDIFGLGLVKAMLYPVFVFFGGNWNEFRFVLAGISLVFLYVLFELAWSKKYKQIGIVLVLLTLANVRLVEPGVIFYEAFHMIQWFGLFLFFTGLMISCLKSNKQKYIVFGALALSLLIYLLHPQTFFKRSPDPHAEFLTSYGRTLETGEAVKTLSTPNQTFYVDHVDELNLVYFQAQRLSPYTYSWYNFVAPGFKPYTDARRDMIENNPPDFWFSFAEPERPDMYTRLLQDGKPGDLYIKTDILEKIAEEQWKIAEEFGYTKPSQENLK